ncbi:MAG: SDR family NAD(P)-dependent oxidoreductase, partial [Myxococcota bacterium]
MPTPSNTLITLLQSRAERTPDLVLYTFLPDGEVQGDTLTCAALEGRARSLAAAFQSLGYGAGTSIVLLFPQGIEFIQAFFGCAYAGIVAAPAPMPHPSRLARTLPRLQGMIADARPAAVVTNREGLALSTRVMADMPEDVRAVPWIALEDCPVDLGSTWRPPSLHPDAIAHLQYTSGSTSAPKGTQITHANILANSRAIQHGWRYSSESRSVVWVPHFHDDGLIQGLIQPIFTGYPCTLFPASAFVSRPSRWLRAITRARGTHSGGPNFAYELCIRKVGEDERDMLDLSSWQVAYNAAEPVRAATLRRFHERFGSVGMRWSSLAPCFGLAESTLLVSTELRDEGPRIVSLDGPSLEKNGRIEPVPEGTAGALTFVCCGDAAIDTEIRIVDPATGAPCPPDRPGEVLVKCASIAGGYRDRPEESERTFRAYLPDGDGPDGDGPDGDGPDGDGPYLRTGDQGFVLEGGLYITGRLKDLIIIRGENRYPQDIEQTVERAHPAVAPGGVAAFSFEAGGEERLGVAAEIKGKPREGVSEAEALQEIIDSLREAITQAHELRPGAIALLAKGRLPKTSSGKLQRRAAARMLVEAKTPMLARFDDASATSQAGPTSARTRAAGRQGGKSATQIEDFMRQVLADQFGVSPHQLAPDVPFSRYGLDSASSVQLSAALGEFVGRPLDAVIAWDHPNIGALSRYLAGVEHADGERGHGAQGGALDEPIAIVGAGCRFPGGVVDIESFWQRLDEGFDAIEPVPPERWAIDAVFSPNPDAVGKMVTRWGGFLPGVDRFDPTFFEISPREADAMDPQLRILLEVTWEALERAGQPLARLRGSNTGVFMGISSHEYQSMGVSRTGRLDPHLFLGTAHSTALGRLSYWLGLRGPNVPVDTACSSSLVAVHLAVQALREGSCAMALAGGVNLVLSPDATVCLSRMRALSPTGRCRTFSANADGYVRSDGAGVVVLKRLGDALRAGDPILALVRGSAVNQDGRSHGLTAPSGPAQQEVIRRALAVAGVSPSEIGYVETHGTGTSLGDPIEVQALAAALGPERPADAPIVLGSVKTNIGHAESAAGVAGLLKAVLSLTHARIPRSLHFDEPNPHIDWSSLPVRVAAEPLRFPETGGPRRAGVSSFGMSGTNAHVVLEQAPRRPEPPQTEPSPGEAPVHVLPLSAKSPEALVAVARSMRAFIESSPERLADITYTASVRRTHHEQRLAIVGNSKDRIVEALDVFVQGKRSGPLWIGRAMPRPKVVFVFPGQGSQWARMGAGLLETSPVYRRALEDCAVALSPHVSFSVLEELSRPEGHARLDQTEVAQCALFAVQVALASLLRSLGVVPQQVVGHSVGEIAAAHVAGILELGEAARLVALRARVMQRATGRGQMVAAALTEAEARDELRGLEDRIAIAAVNDAEQVVLSGDPEALEPIASRLSARGVECRPLRVDYAFHSPQMEPLRDELVGLLAGLEPKRASTQTQMISTVTGDGVVGDELLAGYWGDNIRQTVRLDRAITQARARGGEIFVEVGPHPVLTLNIQRMLAAKGQGGTVVQTLRRGTDDHRRWVECIAALHVQGVEIDWEALWPTRGRVVGLPTYPWQRERHWLEPAAVVPRATTSDHPLLGPAIDSSAMDGVHLFQRSISQADPPWLADHGIQGQVVLPGMAMIEMALSACARALGTAAVELEQVEFVRMLVVPEQGTRQVEVVVHEHGQGLASFHVASRRARDDRWQRHVTGHARIEGPTRDRSALDATMTTEPDGSAERAQAHLAHLARCGLEYGPAFAGLVGLWEQDGVRLGRVRLPEALDEHGVRVHPALLDACIQVSSGLFFAAGEAATWVPVAVQRARFSAPVGREVIARATPSSSSNARDGARDGVCDVELFSPDGTPVGSIEGLGMRRLDASPASGALEAELVHEVVFRRVAPVSGSLPEGTWIVFADRSGVGAEVTRLLRTRGARVLKILAAESYERVEPQLYGIRPAHRGDLARLLDEALTPEQPLAGVVFLWGLDCACADAMPDALTDAMLDEQLAHGLISAVSVAQELVSRPGASSSRLWLVTRGAQAVAQTHTPIAVTQAPLWGLGQTLALEHPSIFVGCVDLPPRGEAEDAAQLVRELSSGDREDRIALRGGERHVARLVHGGRAEVAEPVLDPAGAYLVTGGLGGLGLSLAGALVSRGVEHLWLVGRTAPSTEALAAVEAMRARGAEVVCARADVSSREDVERLLASIRERGSALRGVVHAAGVLDDHLLPELSPESFRRVFAPKAHGALLLHQHTRDDPLDLFVMYSSAAALLGSPGQSNYAAANAFLDALARERTRTGRPALSIQWGPFADVGLAAAPAAGGERLERLGLERLAPDEGNELFMRLLGRRTPVIGVLRFDPIPWRSAFPRAQVSPYLDELRSPSAAPRGGSSVRPREELLALPPEVRRERLVEFVRHELAGVLRLESGGGDGRAPGGRRGGDELRGVARRGR